jgi:hypothetical protein
VSIWYANDTFGQIPRKRVFAAGAQPFGCS